MRIHDEITISSNPHLMSLGSLIGGGVSHEVFDQINANGHVSFFGSDFDHMRDNFVKQYVNPMRTLNLELNKTVNAYLNPDTIRLLYDIEDFRSIPPSMELAIALYAPVRKGIEEGRMSGFGYDPATFPDEDVYDRLITNFRCEDVSAHSDTEGYYPISATFKSDDPEFTDDEIFFIERTRDRIRDFILKDTDRDPTDIDNTRG